MKAHLLAQPFANSVDLNQFLAGIGTNSAFDCLRVAVAWVKRSGLQRAEPHLRAIQERHGTLELIVGISQGGATRQGLELAQDIFDQVYVIHDPLGRTFHPKIYLAKGSDQAKVLIGSNNLTAGGLYYNYEAGTILQLDLSDADDRVFCNSVEDVFVKLLSDSAICIPLTPDNLTSLISDRSYRIGDEDANQRQPPATGAPENLDSTGTLKASDATPTLFSSSSVPKNPPIALPIANLPAPRTSSSRHPQGVPMHQSRSFTPSSGTPVTRRWFKRMSRSDAQQKGTANTRVTGNLKLTEADIPINHRIFFRYDLFAMCSWTSTNTTRGFKDEAVVPFHVTIAGRTMGVYNLRVDHADYRVANQGNVPTWLHWGGHLSTYLKKHNHINDYVTLERRANGSYFLTISPNPTGRYIV